MMTMRDQTREIIPMSAKHLLASAIALALTVGSAAPTAAQTGEYREQLDSQIRAALALYTDNGFTIYGGPFYGGLAEDETMSLTVTLIGGKKYVIGGVCDTDCSDLDLEVSNSNGASIGEDSADDDVPMVEVSPRATGPVTVTVKMFKCEAAPCFFAVEVYGQ
jgi:hypothetical protein